jgi:hypothetical protein
MDQVRAGEQIVVFLTDAVVITLDKEAAGSVNAATAIDAQVRQVLQRASSRPRGIYHLHESGFTRSKVVQALRDDSQMGRAFIGKVDAHIADEMFEYGMTP